MTELNDDNFLIFAIKNYDNPNCSGMLDLQEDLKRFKYIKRLFKRYSKTGILTERLILNHIIVLYNVFGSAATKLLFYKIEEEFWSQLKTFLVYLNYMPMKVIGISSNRNLEDIPLDTTIINTLRKI